VKITNSLLTSILIFSFLIGSVTTIQVTGQNGRSIFNGHEYEQILDYRTFLEAKEDCKTRGGYLVTIASLEENEFVASLVTGTIAIIGFTDMETEGEWKWVTDEPITYNYWSSEGPDDAGQEDYAGITYYGTWVDLQVWEEWPYICEWDPVVSDNNSDSSSLAFLFERILIFLAIIIAFIFLRRKIPA
jgi:hypothetical protein